MLTSTTGASLTQSASRQLWPTARYTVEVNADLYQWWVTDSHWGVALFFLLRERVKNQCRQD
jgi:hypothetical protein